MTGSTNASIHFVHLHPRMMWHLSRPAWARYPRLLPKAWIRSAQRLHLTWLSIVEETEPLDKTRAASGTQSSFPKAGSSDWDDISATVREKRMASWSEVLAFKVRGAEIQSDLDSPSFLTMIITRCCFSCWWKIFVLKNWAFQFKYRRKAPSSPLCYLFTYDHKVWENTEILPRRWMLI